MKNKTQKTGWFDYRFYRNILSAIRQDKGGDITYYELISEIFALVQDDFIKTESMEEKTIKDLSYFVEVWKNQSDYPVFSSLRTFGIKTDKAIFVAANVGDGYIGFNDLLQKVASRRNSITFLFTRGELPKGTSRWLRAKMKDKRSLIIPFSDFDVIDILDSLEYGEDCSLESLIVEKVTDVLYGQ